MLINDSFISINASIGIFAATGNQKQKPTIAELICAALAQKILEDDTKLLQADWWNECVGMIPHQATALQNDINVDFHGVSSSSGLDFSHKLASSCISQRFFNTSTIDLKPGIEANLKSRIENLPLKSTSLKLNCLSISFSQVGDLQISLALIASSGIESASGKLIETVVNYSNQNIQKDINEIFGSFEPLKNDEPYYVCVRDKDQVIQN